MLFSSEKQLLPPRCSQKFKVINSLTKWRIDLHLACHLVEEQRSYDHDRPGPAAAGLEYVPTSRVSPAPVGSEGHRARLPRSPSRRHREGRTEVPGLCAGRQILEIPLLWNPPLENQLHFIEVSEVGPAELLPKECR